jgi:6-phosphofructokinase 1
MTIEELFDKLDEGEKTNRKSSLVVVAEGSKLGGALELARKVTERNNYFDIKVTILGHLQRGGAPSYFDRVLASEMGIAAVEGLLKDQSDAIIGIRHNKIVYNLYDTIITQHHEIDSELIRIAKILSI